MPLSSRSLAQCLYISSPFLSVSIPLWLTRSLEKSQKLKRFLFSTILLSSIASSLLPSSLFFLTQKTCYFPCLRRFLSHCFSFFTSSDCFFHNVRDVSFLRLLHPALPLHYLPHRFLHRLLLHSSSPCFSRLMKEYHQHLDKPMYESPRNVKNNHSREEEEESSHLHHMRDLSCYYGLRENPKKKTLKSFELESPEPIKKILFRCGECGKGFRYEKCLLNHQAWMHLSMSQRVCEKSIKSLCFSLVRKKKRSRVIRYKKIPLSCSLTTFLDSPSVFAENDDELEVAECLILLSKSSPKSIVDGMKLVGEAMDANPETSNGFLSYKKLRKAAEFEDGVFSSEGKLMEERFSRYETSKEPASFLGDSSKFDQQKRRKAGESESGFSRNEQKLLKEEISSDETWTETANFLGRKYELGQWKVPKSCDFEAGIYGTELRVEAMECSDSDTEIVTERDRRDVEHQCRLCNKIFSSYQALGGHQTFHRMSRSKKQKNCGEESVEPEDESVTVKEEKTRHKGSTCSRKFRSVHALGGHKKCHSKTVGIEFY